MKIYKCDSCGRMIEHPHKQKMKEFVVHMSLELGVFVSINLKKRQKIDICEECFDGLKNIAERKVVLREVNAIKREVLRDVIAIIEPRTNGDLGRQFPELESIKEIYGI